MPLPTYVVSQCKKAMNYDMQKEMRTLLKQEGYL